MLSLLFLQGSILAQTKTISGKVTDQKGDPIAGASVVTVNATTGSSTDADGRYSFSAPAAVNFVQVSAVNYNSLRVRISGNTANAILTSKAGNLEEVVVTGITRVRKSQYTGAASKIDKKQLENQPVGSFDQLLQGRAPGVTALTGSGAPGTTATVIIRGQGSINGGNAPLYVVDGVPIESSAFQGLNPNDFESVDILRDASTASLYGSRGSAGVIVVTTKKGTAGKLKLSYTGQLGLKSAPEFPFRSMNTAEILKAQEDYGKVLTAADPTSAVINNTNIPGFYYSAANPRFAGLSAAQQTRNLAILDSISKINTNWGNEIFRPASFSNHQLTLSGGTGKTRFYSSLGLYNEEGTTLRTDMKRVTLRNNIDFTDDRFTMAAGLNLGYTKRNFEQSSAFNTSNPFATSALAVPYHLVKKDDGTYQTGIGTKFVGTNQLDQTFYDQNYSDQFKGIASLNFSYKLTDHLTAAVVSGIDFRETQATNYGSKLVFTRLTSTSITGRAGFQLESLNRFLTGTVRPSLTYRRNLKENHDFEVSTIGEYIREYAKVFSVQGFGTDPKRPNTIAAIQPSNATNQLYPNITGSKGTSSLVSGLITGRYTYKNKYTVSGSYRKDGSSKLPVDTRWQDFYSVGLVWDAAKESFISNIRPINSLRIRASYGSAGNANNFPGGFYPYQASYTGGNYSGITTIVSNYAGNPNLKWEKIFTTNVGVDFEIVNRRIYGDVNIYDRRTKDLFVAKALSSVAGFGNGATLNVNAGELQNKGFEWNVSGEIIRNQNLVWTVFTNGAYNKNKVLDLGGEESFETGTEKITIGLPLGSHYEVKWAGVDQATGAPLYYDLDGKITNIYSAENAVQSHGTWEAPWRGGFGSSIKFKGFDLSCLFSWQKGGNKYDNLEFFLENPNGFMAFGYNQSASLNFWKKPGDVASTPSPAYSVNFSSRFIHDASFVRLRDVTLAYTLPKDLLARTKFMSNMRFYVQGTNLSIWTRWRGRDPEAGATNLNISEYPNPRALTAGVEVTF